MGEKDQSEMAQDSHLCISYGAKFTSVLLSYSRNTKWNYKVRTLAPKKYKKESWDHLPGIEEEVFETCLFGSHKPYSTKLVL